MGTIALTGAARASVGPIPRKKVRNPSARYDCSAQSNALEYFRPAPMISVCSRDLITSAISFKLRDSIPIGYADSHIASPDLLSDKSRSEIQCTIETQSPFRDILPLHAFRSVPMNQRFICQKVHSTSSTPK